MNFPSKRDTWLVWVLSVAALLEAIAAVALIAVVLPSTIGPARSQSDVAAPVVLGAGLLLGAGAIVVAWVLFGTSYSVTASDLLIRSGPMRWRVSIARIVCVTPTNRIDSAPALSLSRIELRCVNPDKALVISPDDPTGFVAALQQVKPAITWGGGAPIGA